MEAAVPSYHFSIGPYLDLDRFDIYTTAFFLYTLIQLFILRYLHLLRAQSRLIHHQHLQWTTDSHTVTKSS